MRVGHGFEIPESVHEAVDLTSFAWEARYPGATEPVTEAEYLDAIAIAERVVRWAASLVEVDASPGPEPRPGDW